MYFLGKRNDPHLLGSPENCKASEKHDSSRGSKCLLMIQPYKTVKIPSSQKRPVTYYFYCNTKLQEMGGGIFWVISLHYSPKLS